MCDTGSVRYYEIGSSGGGADKLLVRDDDVGALCYYNDFDCTLTEFSADLDAFIASLKLEDD
ncbi:hypothetical protein [Aeoliella sp.]|uniref:hypothetical protein n=1 Tax=Aeoliella sp. TaxID=2795800 RepID=UPI003CCBC3C7